MSDKFVSPSGRDMDESPISQMGRVTVNCRIDIKAIKLARRLPSNRLFYEDSAVRDEGTWDLNKPELAIMRNAEQLEMNGHRLGRRPLVLSNLSALRKDQASTLYDAIAQYELVGMIQGPVKVHMDRAEGVDVSVTVGGLMSLINTDIQPIYNGDMIYWDFPKLTADKRADQSDFTKPAYFKPGKIPIVIRRFTYENSANTVARVVRDFAQASRGTKPTKANGGLLVQTFVKMAALFRDTADDDDAANLLLGLIGLDGEGVPQLSSAQKDVFTDFLSQSLYLHRRVKDRIFARAYSNSAPGTHVDIVMNAYRH